MLGAMKSITSTLNGLVSSLLLNVGLTRAAEKLDPLASQSAANLQNSGSALATISCSPCHYSTRRR